MPVPPFATESVPVVSARAIPREEVAMTVGTAEPPVALAQRELAAMAAKPTDCPAPSVVSEPVRPVPMVAEEVATPYTPAPPFDTRMLDEEGCEVVARPVYVMVELEPPTRVPRVEKPLNGPLKVTVEVATVARALVPLPYVTPVREPAPYLR